MKAAKLRLLYAGNASPLPLFYIRAMFWLSLLLVVIACAQLGYVESFLPADAFESSLEDKWLDWEKRRPRDKTALPPFAGQKVSVVICAKNEAANLARHLPEVLNQQYHDPQGDPQYEVIVVNDGSTDETAALLVSLSRQYAHLRILNIAVGAERDYPGKKHALSKGIAAAAFDVILMTDADCRPASRNWVAWMAAPFLNGQEIVAGYGGYDETAGILNKFIRCETIHTFALLHGFCRRNRPYMAVGRNLACKKSLLAKAQQHPHWRASPSGDDDMLVQLCATEDNMIVNIDPESHTYSAAKSSWKSYLLQKQRHVSTGKLYKRKIKMLLGGYALSHAAYWMVLAVFIRQLFGPGFSMALQVMIGGGALVIIMRHIMLYHQLDDWEEQLHGKKSIKRFWYIFDFAWMLYNVILAPYILWKTKRRWK